MKGKVTSLLEAKLKFLVKGQRKRSRRITAVVDTGYSGMLTLPPDLIRSLALFRVGQSDFTLADGSKASFDVYFALLKWDGRTKAIYVDEARADPLVGMRLLAGHDLAIRVKKGGNVSVKRF